MTIEAEVASIAVMTNDGKLLMGKRKDNGKWTLPGGHLEEGETPHDGALRELYEEAGIQASGLYPICSEPVTTFTGRNLIIHAFQCVTPDESKITIKNDPDEEVERWQWVDVKDGLPKEIEENLHSPKNVVLRAIGLQKADPLFIDLMKADRIGHKYIRKYRRGGKWVYIYHEPDAHPREIPEEAVNKIHRAAELGHKPAKKLVESIEEHSPEKLKLLIRAHELGHKPATDYLRSLGINPDNKKTLDELIMPRGLATEDLPEKYRNFDPQKLSRDMEKTKDDRRKKMDEEYSRRERAQQAREIAERELSGSMANYIRSISNQTISTETVIELQKFFTKAFGSRADGKSLRAEDFPYNFEEHGVTVKIVDLRVGRDSVKMRLAAYDADGNLMTGREGNSTPGRGWTRRWILKEDGSVTISNDLLLIKPEARNTVKLGALINKNQVKMLKEFSPQGRIEVHANCDVGGYNWANQGFKFSDEDDLSYMRRKFKEFCAEHGVNLTASDLKKFKLPCHFSSFDPGVYVEADINGQTEKIHLGKAFLLKKDWYGTMEMDEMNGDNPAYRFFEDYRQMRRETWKKLEPEFQELVEKYRERQESGGSTQGQPPLPGPTRLPRGYRDWDARRLRDFYTESRASLSQTQRRLVVRAYRVAYDRERRSA